MAVVKLITDRAQVLHAALMLNAFTVRELADFSGVKINTVRTVLTRDASFFQALDAEPTGKRGGQFRRYMLAEGVRERLKSLLIGLPAWERPQFAIAAEQRSASEEEAENKREAEFLSALAAASSAFEQAQHASDGPMNWRLRAEEQLRAAQLSLQAVANSPRREELQRQLSDLETRAQLRETARKTADAVVRLPLPSAWLEQLRYFVPLVRRWLFDWSYQLDVLHSPPTNERALFEGSVVPLIEEKTLNLNQGDMLLPAAAFVAARSHFSSAEISTYRAAVAQRLSDVSLLSAPVHYSALVTCAAVMGAQDALNSIVGAIATPDFERCLVAETRENTLLAIARFARPNAKASSSLGSIACYLLLSRSSQRERDMPCLLPGALLAQNVDAFGMLDEFAQAYYGRRDSAQHSLCIADECALMRNLGVVINAEAFKGIQPCANRLLAHEHGRKLLQALRSRKYGALHVREDDAHGFVVGPGYALLECGDVAELFEQPLQIAADTEERRHLNHILTSDSMTLAPDAFAGGVRSGVNSPDSPFFSELLRRSSWVERRKKPRFTSSRIFGEEG